MPRGRPHKNLDAALAPKKVTKARKAKAAAATLGFEQQMFLAAVLPVLWDTPFTQIRLLGVGIALLTLVSIGFWSGASSAKWLPIRHLARGNTSPVDPLKRGKSQFI